MAATAGSGWMNAEDTPTFRSQHAFVAIEDHRFFSHPVDPIALEGDYATCVPVERKGSTLTARADLFVNRVMAQGGEGVAS
jgi:hypothetical protein